MIDRAMLERLRKKSNWGGVGLEMLDTIDKLLRVYETASIGLTISCDCDGNTRPCGVCDLRDALEAVNRSEKGDK